MKRLKRLLALSTLVSALVAPAIGSAEQESIPTIMWAREVIMRADGLNGAWFAGDLKTQLIDARTGDGVPGQMVTFLHGEAPFCEAMTNEFGVANCTDPVAQVNTLLNGGYTARFAGNGPLLPSSDSAPLAHVLGTDI